MPEAIPSPQTVVVDSYSGPKIRVAIVESDLCTTGEMGELQTSEEHFIVKTASLGESWCEGLGGNRWGAATVGQVNWCLGMIGSPERITVRWRQICAEAIDLFLRGFLHLRSGGMMIFERMWFVSDAEFGKFAKYLMALKAFSFDPHESDHALSQVEEKIAKSIGQIEIGSQKLRVEKTGYHLLKVRDADATRLLTTRNRSWPPARNLHTCPGYTWDMQQEEIHYTVNGFSPASFDRQMVVPKRYCRSVTGATKMIERCLTLQDNVVLPQSFRFHLQPHLGNPRLEPINADFSTIKGNYNLPAGQLPGVYFDLDCSNSGHFGHVTTEVVSRLWGWREAKAQIPDLKVLFRIRRPGERVPRLEVELFRAFGIQEEDIVWTPRPVSVDGLVGATPQWHNSRPYYADKGITETWNRIKEGLGDSDVPVYERLFISRRGKLSNRRCLNAAGVEECFREAGYQVVYPEDYTLAEQANLFSNARVVGGFGGSALFNLMFSQHLEHLVVLNQEAYTARNEHLYSGILDVSTSYFWSVPEVEHPPGGWSEDAYFSDWNFDFDALGGKLEQVITAV